jgi:hypothetical protein
VTPWLAGSTRAYEERWFAALLIYYPGIAWKCIKAKAIAAGCPRTVAHEGMFFV